MSVFVSGANGFIAQHILAQLLAKDYNVIAAVRSQEKADGLLKNFDNPNLQCVIVPDITKLEAFDDAFKNNGSKIKYVIHAASPVTDHTDNFERDILIPAVNGTKAILNSIKKYASENVERFIQTSSLAALTTVQDYANPKLSFNEKSWSTYTWESCQGSMFDAYSGSKKFAEQEVWKFAEENRDTIKFSITTVNPAFVFGPQVFDNEVKSKLNVTCQIVNDMIHLPIGATDFSLNPLYCVHVEDVAKAHVQALDDPTLVGKRLLMSNGLANRQDMLNIAHDDFPILNGNVAVGTPSNGFIGKPLPVATLDNTDTKQLLGFQFKSLNDMFDDLIRQVLKHEGKI